MKSTGIVRKVDELGRVVLPIELRDMLDVQIKDSLEIFMDEEEEIIVLKKYQGSSCIFCGKYSSDLIYYKKYLVCRTCISELDPSTKTRVGEGDHDSKEVAATISEIEMDTKKGKRRKGNKSADVMNQLHAAIMANPKASQMELARELGISQGYVCILMKKLRDSGLITKGKRD
ncbi:AbrB/MazE/SpoVT family DNA-binding domain-containing protein [Brevibacillus agri]|uniref:AbrB/MazE/SpoVT family DNA-binding domain-containing protein n=1 Tax=Brevibacillus TaxID=55080 RepID=UPI0023681A46|nr:MULTISPECIES: AbrB/MazE/SpoVT family DNA-binding domain-containing protein [Brevibacillus]MED1646880.1 AbrB/MazE/SpoVT family DNA-binding domain-containing protein [Brevibacillus agri]MED1657618.1 AbrB/MazE/SpoVT family DNA-binding domain-containing protein [Brevibacillus agri]MED1690050.1 AbrB/MazE/SpoVT family DNA-binding domain-containing protein [Brevibacillus agri]MED1691659.1 AbrB/MazE/SpoVT family DNA-binding domain-containing protein [Brevibacillus agri]MED1700804.1 AbrB/MazE/SpoVT 